MPGSAWYYVPLSRPFSHSHTLLLRASLFSISQHTERSLRLYITQGGGGGASLCEWKHLCISENEQRLCRWNMRLSTQQRITQHPHGESQNVLIPITVVKHRAENKPCNTPSEKLSRYPLLCNYWLIDSYCSFVARVVHADESWKSLICFLFCCSHVWGFDKSLVESAAALVYMAKKHECFIPFYTGLWKCGDLMGNLALRDPSCLCHFPYTKFMTNSDVLKPILMYSSEASAKAVSAQSRVVKLNC